MNLPDGATSVDVASMPWAMTQSEPLAVEDFIKEAQKRGVDLRPASLRELYRHRLLIPFVQVTTRPVRSLAGQDTAESPFGGARITDLRQARDTGRLRDLAALPYQPRLSFEPVKWTWPSNSPWTGVLYSPYQLLALPELGAALARQTFHKRGERIIARMPKPGQLLLDRMERLGIDVPPIFPCLMEQVHRWKVRLQAVAPAHDRGLFIQACGPEGLRAGAGSRPTGICVPDRLYHEPVNRTRSRECRYTRACIRSEPAHPRCQGGTA